LYTEKEEGIRNPYNWGLAIWDINVVDKVLGAVPILVTIVYALVGLSALYAIYKLFK